MQMGDIPSVIGYRGEWGCREAGRSTKETRSRGRSLSSARFGQIAEVACTMYRLYNHYDTLPYSRTRVRVRGRSATELWLRGRLLRRRARRLSQSRPYRPASGGLWRAMEVVVVVCTACMLFA